MFLQLDLNLNSLFVDFSVYHSMWGKMTVYLPQLETGTKLKIKMNVTTGLSGKFQCNYKEFNTTTEFDLPKDKAEIFSAECVEYTSVHYFRINKFIIIQCIIQILLTNHFCSFRRLKMTFLRTRNWFVFCIFFFFLRCVCRLLALDMVGLVGKLSLRMSHAFDRIR